MIQRHVDVTDKAGKILHTYPITLPASNTSPKDADYENAAIAAAKMAKLVPDVDVAHLRARLHPVAAATTAAA